MLSIFEAAKISRAVGSNLNPNSQHLWADKRSKMKAQNIKMKFYKDKEKTIWRLLSESQKI